MSPRSMRGPVFAALLAAALAACGGDDLTAIERPWRPDAARAARLPPGIEVLTLELARPPLRAFAVRVASGHGLRARVRVANDEDGRATVSALAQDEPSALVVMNAGYFGAEPGRTTPVGLLLAKGDLVHPAADFVTRGGLRYPCARGAIGFDARGAGDVAWAATDDGEIFELEQPPANAPGRPAPPPAERRPWPMTDAVQGGPVLVHDGRARVCRDEEVFFGTIIPGVHPRSAAGLTRDGTLVLVVVDGRQEASRGVTLEELAVLMLDHGCVEALNLDGGGSSALVVLGELLNRPQGSTLEREVASALAVLQEE